jgi:archaetidylinositol phosphate synthase
MLRVDFNYPLTRYLYRPVSRPLAARLARTHFTPNQVTLLSAVVTAAGGVAFLFQTYYAGVLLALVGQIADCADGDMARLQGRTSPAGAFLDSVLDRWTDAALILGLGFSDLERYGGPAALALAGSFLVSYTRARAQSVGVDCADGIATRDARMLIIMGSALTRWIEPGLLVLAALGALTSVTRTAWAMRALGTSKDRSPL